MDSLRRFWQFHNSDPEVASADVSNVLAPVRFKILGPNSDFHHSIQIAQIGDIHVWHSISSTGFVLKKQPVRKSIFELHFLEEGNCSTIANNQSVGAGPGDVLLLREPNKHDLFCQPDTVQLCIAIPLERYSEVMAAEFGDPFADLSAMRPGATCQKASIQSLKQIVELMLSLRRNDPAPEKASIGALLLSKGFLAFFGESWPRLTAYRNNESARPFYIKKAVEWMQLHAAEKPSIEQLSSASGVSIRTLQIGFQNFYGQSPMAFLLKVRLEKAYKDLLTQPTTITIDEIARRWGFSNPGKFSAQIRATYGDGPFAIRRGSKRT
ncbi:helix-turn-helix domain-containing protein [Agrobacterium tumefaciens]|jgi:AraC-like DNA-binding protein|uniref:helix-turn-helix domain-containing protein n=1 Tax=Agrobacterium tumefaciens TaxID=358 RepID=UPI001CBF869B|nr:AraC family transcriptional regulator [Agrobacterium tumefaciens]